MATDAVKAGLQSPAVILVGNAISEAAEAADWVNHHGTSALAVDKHAAFNAWQDLTEAIQHAA
jgi:uroporphyrin-III C-methyltransferase